jgi:hypothetical protein
MIRNRSEYDQHGRPQTNPIAGYQDRHHGLSCHVATAWSTAGAKISSRAPDADARAPVIVMRICWIGHSAIG